MNTHTPGPWLRDKTSGISCDVRASSGRKVALCWGLTTRDPTRPAYRAECDANARLIAAAPDMLATLRSLIEADAEGHMMPKWLVEEARTAISKATGENQ